MGFKHATVRQRLFRAIKHEAEDNKHRHFHEYLHEGVFVLTNFMFLAGSFCFLEHIGFSTSVVMVGDWLFIAAAFLQLTLVAQDLHEKLMAKKHLSAKFNERDRSEILETCFVLIACFVFWLGSICFMPGIYGTEKQERLGHEIGAWSFVIGSIGLVLASYHNALELAAERAKHPEDYGAEKLVYQLHCCALCFAQLGGAAFACGSFLYRPQFQNSPCHKASRNVNSVEEGFDTAMNSGSILYIVGSLLFVVQSILCLIAVVLKCGKEVESESEDERDTFRHAKREGSRRSAYGSTLSKSATMVL